MFEVNIFLETSLKGPGTRIGWYAAVVECHTQRHGIQTREDFVVDEETTYHKSVLRALIKALKRLNANCNLKVFTDSKFVSSGVEKNLQRWKENGFVNAKGVPIGNQAEWMEVSKLISGHKVEFVVDKKHEYSTWMDYKAESIRRNGLNTECKG